MPADATPRHRWIADAVAQLTDLDPDGAQQRNGAGWNKVDGGPGRHYAHKIRAGSMTAADWADAERRVSRYVRTQISPLLQGSEAEPGCYIETTERDTHTRHALRIAAVCRYEGKGKQP